MEQINYYVSDLYEKSNHWIMLSLNRSAYLKKGKKISCKKRYLYFKPSIQLMHEWLNLCTTFYGLFFWKRLRQLKTSTKASYFRRLCYGARKLLEMVWDGKFGDKLIQCALRLIEHCVTKRYVAFRSFEVFIGLQI